MDELPEGLRRDPLVERYVSYLNAFLLVLTLFPSAVEMLSRAKLSREEVADYEYSLKHARDEYAIQMTIEEKDRKLEEMKREREENHRTIEEKDRTIEALKRALAQREEEVRSKGRRQD